MQAWRSESTWCRPQDVHTSHAGRKRHPCTTACRPQGVCYNWSSCATIGALAQSVLQSI